MKLKSVVSTTAMLLAGSSYISIASAQQQYPLCTAPYYNQVIMYYTVPPESYNDLFKVINLYKEVQTDLRQSGYRSTVCSYRAYNGLNWLSLRVDLGYLTQSKSISVYEQTRKDIVENSFIFYDWTILQLGTK